MDTSPGSPFGQLHAFLDSIQVDPRQVQKAASMLSASIRHPAYLARLKQLLQQALVRAEAIQAFTSASGSLHPTIRLLLSCPSSNSVVIEAVVQACKSLDRIGEASRAAHLLQGIRWIPFVAQKSLMVRYVLSLSKTEYSLALREAVLENLPDLLGFVARMSDEEDTVLEELYTYFSSSTGDAVQVKLVLEAASRFGGPESPHMRGFVSEVLARLSSLSLGTLGPATHFLLAHCGEAHSSAGMRDDSDVEVYSDEDSDDGIGGAYSAAARGAEDDEDEDEEEDSEQEGGYVFKRRTRIARHGRGKAAGRRRMPTAEYAISAVAGALADMVSGMQQAYAGANRANKGHHDEQGGGVSSRSSSQAAGSPAPEDSRMADSGEQYQDAEPLLYVRHQLDAQLASFVRSMRAAVAESSAIANVLCLPLQHAQQGSRLPASPRGSPHCQAAVWLALSAALPTQGVSSIGSKGRDPVFDQLLSTHGKRCLAGGLAGPGCLAGFPVAVAEVQGVLQELGGSLLQMKSQTAVRTGTALRYHLLLACQDVSVTSSVIDSAVCHLADDHEAVRESAVRTLAWSTIGTATSGANARFGQGGQALVDAMRARVARHRDQLIGAFDYTAPLGVGQVRALYDAAFGCNPIRSSSTGGAGAASAAGDPDEQSTGGPSDEDCVRAEEQSDELFILIKKQLANPTEHYRRVAAIGVVAALRWWSAAFMPVATGGATGSIAACASGQGGSLPSTASSLSQSAGSNGSSESFAAGRLRGWMAHPIPSGAVRRCTELLLHAMDALKRDTAALSLLLEEIRLCLGGECLAQRGSAASDLTSIRQKMLEAASGWDKELLPQAQPGSQSAARETESPSAEASASMGPGSPARGKSASFRLPFRPPVLPLELPDSYGLEAQLQTRVAYQSRLEPDRLPMSQQGPSKSSADAGMMRTSLCQEDVGACQLCPGIRRAVRQVIHAFFVSNFICTSSNDTSSGVDRLFNGLTKRCSDAFRPKLWRNLNEDVSFFGVQSILPNCDAMVEMAKDGVPSSISLAALHPSMQRQTLLLPTLRTLLHLQQNYCEGLDDVPRAAIAMESCFTPSGFSRGYFVAALCSCEASAVDAVSRLVCRINFVRSTLQYLTGIYSPSDGAVGLDGEDDTLLQRFVDCAELETMLQLAAFAPLLHALGEWHHIGSSLGSSGQGAYAAAPHFVAHRVDSALPPPESMGNCIYDLASARSQLHLNLAQAVKIASSESKPAALYAMMEDDEDGADRGNVRDSKKEVGGAVPHGASKAAGPELHLSLRIPAVPAVRVLRPLREPGAATSSLPSSTSHRPHDVCIRAASLVGLIPVVSKCMGEHAGSAAARDAGKKRARGAKAAGKGSAAEGSKGKKARSIKDLLRQSGGKSNKSGTDGDHYPRMNEKEGTGDGDDEDEDEDEDGGDDAAIDLNASATTDAKLEHLIQGEDLDDDRPIAAALQQIRGAALRRAGEHSPSTASGAAAGSSTHTQATPRPLSNASIRKLQKACVGQWELLESRLLPFYPHTAAALLRANQSRTALDRHVARLRWAWDQAEKEAADGTEPKAGEGSGPKTYECDAGHGWPAESEPADSPANSQSSQETSLGPASSKSNCLGYQSLASHVVNGVADWAKESLLSELHSDRSRRRTRSISSMALRPSLPLCVQLAKGLQRVLEARLGSAANTAQVPAAPFDAPLTHGKGGANFEGALLPDGGSSGSESWTARPILNDGHTPESFLVSCAAPLLRVFAASFNESIAAWKAARDGGDPRKSSWPAAAVCRDDETRETLRRHVLSGLHVVVRAAIRSNDAVRAAAAVAFLQEWVEATQPIEGTGSATSPKRQSNSFRRAAAAMAAAEAAARGSPSGKQAGSHPMSSWSSRAQLGCVRVVLYLFEQVCDTMPLIHGLADMADAAAVASDCIHFARRLAATAGSRLDYQQGEGVQASMDSSQVMQEALRQRGKQDYRLLRYVPSQLASALKAVLQSPLRSTAGQGKTVRRMVTQCITQSSDPLATCESLLQHGLAPVAAHSAIAGDVKRRPGSASEDEDDGELHGLEWRSLDSSTFDHAYKAVIDALTSYFVAAGKSAHSSAGDSLKRAMGSARRAADLWAQSVMLTRQIRGAARSKAVLLSVLRSAKPVMAALVRLRGVLTSRLGDVLDDAMTILRVLQGALRQVLAVAGDGGRKRDARRMALLPAIHAGQEKILQLAKEVAMLHGGGGAFSIGRLKPKGISGEVIRPGSAAASQDSKSTSSSGQRAASSSSSSSSAGSGAAGGAAVAKSSSSKAPKRKNRKKSSSSPSGAPHHGSVMSSNQGSILSAFGTASARGSQHGSPIEQGEGTGKGYYGKGAKSRSAANGPRPTAAAAAVAAAAAAAGSGAGSGKPSQEGSTSGSPSSAVEPKSGALGL